MTKSDIKFGFYAENYPLTPKVRCPAHSHHPKMNQPKIAKNTIIRPNEGRMTKSDVRFAFYVKSYPSAHVFMEKQHCKVRKRDVCGAAAKNPLIRPNQGRKTKSGGRFGFSGES